MKHILLLMLLSSVSFSMMPPGGQQHRDRQKIIEQTPEKLECESYTAVLDIVKKRIANKQSLERPIQTGIFNHQTTLLVFSINKDYLPITQLLLEHGANPNNSGNGCSPLMAAAHHYNDKVTQLLLENGANPNGFDANPLLVICDVNKDSYDKNTLEKRVAVATALLKAGANPNIQQISTEDTCLHNLITRSAYGHREMIHEDAFRKLYLANRKSLIKLLIDYGGDLTRINRDGRTPLELIFFEGYGEYYCNPENKKDCQQLINFALSYARLKLLTILCYPGCKGRNASPFMKLPKELVKMIVFKAYPCYNKNS